MNGKLVQGFLKGIDPLSVCLNVNLTCLGCCRLRYLLAAFH